MDKLHGLYKDFCAIGGQLPTDSKAKVEEDVISDIEDLDNEVRGSESPVLIMLEVEGIEEDESKELDFDSKISIRRSEHGDAAFCGGNLDFSQGEYV